MMQGTHLELRQWAMAFHLLCSSKKGFSALQLQRNLGIGSYRTALFMMHRIRLAMREEPVKDMLKGTVEVDETYIGGKPRYKGASKKGRGTKKIPVLALVERDGKATSRRVTNVTGRTLKTAIRQTVDKSSTIMTDEWAAYNGIGKEFEGGHEVVNHGRKEYVRGLSTTNTVESYFALMKRGVMGVYHSVSKQHLDRYCDEFSFRWNRRKISDSERTDDAIRNASGKRLVYQS
jgi:transposase-like protein